MNQLKQSVTNQTKTPQNETKLLRMLKIWEQASYMIQKKRLLSHL